MRHFDQMMRAAYLFMPTKIMMNMMMKRAKLVAYIHMKPLSEVIRAQESTMGIVALAFIYQDSVGI